MLRNGKPSNFLELIGYLSYSPFLHSIMPPAPPIGQMTSRENDLLFVSATARSISFKTGLGGKTTLTIADPAKDVKFFQNRFEIPYRGDNEQHHIYYYRDTPDCDTLAFEGVGSVLSAIESGLIQPSREVRLCQDAAASLREEMDNFPDNPDVLSRIQLRLEVPNTNNDTADTEAVKAQLKVHVEAFNLHGTVL